MLDDVPPHVSRFKVREKLDYDLLKPFDADELHEYEHANWGLDSEAIEAAALTENMDAAPSLGSPVSMPRTAAQLPGEAMPELPRRAGG